MAQQELTPKEQFAYQFGYTNKSNGSNFGPSPKQDENYGNSLFKLVTYNQNKETKKNENIILTGILSEMPEFSFDINYTDGPGKSTQDTLSMFFENDLFSIVNAVGPEQGSFKNLISTGKLSKSMYNGISSNDITLKFRIYSQNTLGQTPVAVWREQLTAMAIPSTDNEYDIKAGITNILQGLKNAANTGSNIIYAFNGKEAESTSSQKPANTADLRTDTQKIESNARKSQSLSDKFERVLREWKAEANNAWISDNTISGKTVYNSSDGDYTEAVRFDYSTYQDYNEYTTLLHGYGFQKYARISISFYHFVYHSWRPNTSGRESRELGDKCYYYQNDDTKKEKELAIYDGKVNDSVIQEWIKSVKTDLEKAKEFNSGLKNFFNNQFENLYKKLVAIDDPPTKTKLEENKEQTQKTIKESNKLIATVTEISGKIQEIGSKFTDMRVFTDTNATTSLGEKLWALTIYNNFLFKNPLNVIIKNWSIQDSKEVVNGAPVYSDINIVCGYDQIYSSDTWEKILY